MPWSFVRLTVPFDNRWRYRPSNITEPKEKSLNVHLTLRLWSQGDLPGLFPRAEIGEVKTISAPAVNHSAVIGQKPNQFS